MRKLPIFALTVLLICLCAVATTRGQQPTATPATPEQQQSPAQTPNAGASRTTRESDGQTSRVFEIKHRSPEAMLPVLRPLGSYSAVFTTSREFKTITVRDVPENLRQIEQAIRRLDVPEAVGRTVELRFYVLIASNSDAATGNQSTGYPAELGQAVKQLQTTLNYKNYSLVSSLIQRAKEGGRSSGSGSFNYVATNAQNAANTVSASFRYETGAIDLRAASAGSATVVHLQRFNFEAITPREGIPSVSTELDIREGEQVVVGTATFGDRALVLVLSARVNSQ